MALKVRMLCNWFDGGELLFKAGELYEESPATLAQVKRGNAQRVDVPDEAAAAEGEGESEQPPEQPPEAPSGDEITGDGTGEALPPITEDPVTTEHVAGPVPARAGRKAKA